MARYVPDKNLSLFAAVALGVGCTVGWGAFIMPGTTFLPKAGPVGAAIALACCALTALVIAVSYRYLMRRFPVDGGSFSFTMRAFGRHHAYICGWSLAIAYLIIIPANATALSLLTQATALDILQQGPVYSMAGYDTYLLEPIVYALVLGGFALLAAYGGRKAFVVESVFVSCMVVGLVVLCLGVLLVPTAPVTLDPAFHPGTSPVAGVLAIVAIGPWIFIGFGSASQLAGEFNFSPRKGGIVVLLAIVAALLSYLALNTLASACPPGFPTWAHYMDATVGYTGVAAFPLFQVVNVQLGQAGMVVLGLTMLAAIFSGVLGFYLVTTRLLVSMARNGVLSDWFGELGGSKRRPLHAVFFLFVASFVIACLGRNILQWIVSMSAAGAAVAFLYSCASAFKFARKEGKPLVSGLAALGVVASATLLAMLLVPQPALGVSLSWESILFAVAWAALGFNFYTPAVPHYDASSETIVIAEVPTAQETGA